MQYVFVLTISQLRSLVNLRKVFIPEKFREFSAHPPLKTDSYYGRHSREIQPSSPAE